MNNQTAEDMEKLVMGNRLFHHTGIPDQAIETVMEHAPEVVEELDTYPDSIKRDRDSRVVFALALWRAANNRISQKGAADLFEVSDVAVREVQTLLIERDVIGRVPTEGDASHDS